MPEDVNSALAIAGKEDPHDAESFLASYTNALAKRPQFERPQAELKSYTPTARERLHYFLTEMFGDGREVAQSPHMRAAMNAIDLLPPGWLLAAYDAGRGLATDPRSPYPWLMAAAAAVPPGRATLRGGTKAAWERSLKTGHDEIKWYHGTNSPAAENILREGFKPELAGQAAGMALNKRPAIWITDNPNLAGKYAMEVADRHGGSLAIIPLRMRPGEHKVIVNMKDYNGNPGTWYAMVEEALEWSHKTYGGPPTSVIFTNILPEITGVAGKSTAVMLTDPSRLRSVFAAFDPKKIDSRSLMASLIATGILVPLHQLQKEDQTLSE